jgi:splicing factor U2AF subunit
VVQFLNILTPEDLMDDEEYKEIREDIENVCNNFGEVLEMKIPRPDPKTGIASSAVGKVFVKFSHVVAAKQAR